ncbi:hypothetical protein GCM10010471_31070 [Leucobacter komagatae]
MRALDWYLEIDVETQLGESHAADGFQRGVCARISELDHCPNGRRARPGLKHCRLGQHSCPPPRERHRIGLPADTCNESQMRIGCDEGNPKRI